MKQKGFTLLEIVVVISIIGLLASVILVAVNQARTKARDAKRLATARQIITALEIYLDKYGSYPDPSVYDPSASVCSGWNVSSSGVFLKPLVDNLIIGSLPTDPLNDGGCAFNEKIRSFALQLIPTAQAAVAPPSTNPVGNVFAYSYFSAGSNGCDSKRGNYYVLGIKNMETVGSGTSYPGSPGFKCSGHNWQNDFSWVSGGYER